MTRASSVPLRPHSPSVRTTAGCSIPGGLPGLVLLAIACLGSPVPAAEIFVNNLRGSDAFDGSAETAVDPQVGPTRTLRRALSRTGPGDTVVLANTGVPYYESIALVGPRHSGLGSMPFTIQGNGATLHGTRPVGQNAWRQVQPGVWKVTPWRKGFFQLFRDSQPVAEHPLPLGTKLAQIPPGQWSVRQGSIFYHSRPEEEVLEHAFRVAQRGVGLSLYRVRDVVIRDLNVVGFRIDGGHAVDQCQSVRLINVSLQHNGRSGMAVSGASEVFLTNCRAVDNRLDSIRISGLGAADLKDCQISQPVRVVK